MEPSQPFGDAPCPNCGCLLHFERLDDGIRVSVAATSEDVYVCPQCKTRIPCGTEAVPPPKKCPTCQRSLWIPTVIKSGQPLRVTRHG
jgi:hypothetical protein